MFSICFVLVKEKVNYYSFFMFTYSLRENAKKKRAVYGPSLFFRLLCSIFALFLLLSLIIFTREEGWTSSNLFPLIFFILLLMSVLYRDEWIIDNNKKVFTYVFGLGPFVSRKTYSYEQVRRIEVVHFTKGLSENSSIKPSWRHRPEIILALRTVSSGFEEVHELEIMSERKSAGRVERTANAIVAFTGLPLFVDRPERI